MGLKEWGTGMAIFAFVGVQTAHAVQPLEPKKDRHTHLEKYEQVRTMDNIVMVQTTGSPPLTITVEDGVKVAEAVELRSA